MASDLDSEAACVSRFFLELLLVWIMHHSHPPDLGKAHGRHDHLPSVGVRGRDVLVTVVDRDRRQVRYRARLTVHLSKAVCSLCREPNRSRHRTDGKPRLEEKR